MHFFLLYFLY